MAAYMWRRESHREPDTLANGDFQQVQPEVSHLLSAETLGWEVRPAPFEAGRPHSTSTSQPM